jgi:hypothetical protein
METESCITVVIIASHWTLLCAKEYSASFTLSFKISFNIIY